MIRKLLFIISALALIAGTVEISAQDRVEKIDDLIQKMVDYNSFTGSALVVDDGDVIFKKGYSFANREWDIPNTVDTKFRLGSITKQFTAAIILKLREEGKLNLEDKITDHLKYYRKDTGDSVTIHQLLTHTSGIPSYTNLPNFFSEISTQKTTVEEFVKNYCSGDFEFEPGSQFSYDNSGYYLLGAIIEAITGMTYAEALHLYILNPLQMNDSGFDKFEDILPKRATGYQKLFIEYRNSPYINMEIPYAAGSMYSTVEDIYKWDRALYGTELLSQESLDQFFKPEVDALGGSYAYGWIITEKDVDNDGAKETIISHGGGINGFNTLIARIPDKNQMVVLLNNTGGAPLNFMFDQILKIINDQEYDYPKKGIGLTLYQKYEDMGIDDGVDYYNRLKQTEQLGLFYVDRAELNSLAYYLLNKNDLDAAIKIAELNMREYPDWFNVYDTYAEMLMEKGDKEKSIENYKKSLELNPGNDGAIEKLKEMGVEYKKEISVTDDTMQKYAGKYELAPSFILTIRHEPGQLYAQATGQPEFPIFPSSETKFYLKVVEAQIEFNKNESGEIESLTLYQNGRETPGKKIE